MGWGRPTVYWSSPRSSDPVRMVGCRKPCSKRWLGLVGQRAAGVQAEDALALEVAGTCRSRQPRRGPSRRRRTARLFQCRAAQQRDGRVGRLVQRLDPHGPAGDAGRRADAAHDHRLAQRVQLRFEPGQHRRVRRLGDQDRRPRSRDPRPAHRARTASSRRPPPRTGRGRRRRCRATRPRRARPAAPPRSAARCPMRPRSRCGRATRRSQNRALRRRDRPCPGPVPCRTVRGARLRASARSRPRPARCR